MGDFEAVVERLRGIVDDYAPGFSWRVLRAVDGEELLVDGIFRGEVVRDDREGDRPFRWSACTVLRGWVEGRSVRRSDALRQVEALASAWL